MKLLGRIAVVCGWAVLAGCGVETTDNAAGLESQAAEVLSTTCPELVPPADNFCPNGTIAPVYEGKCIVGYECNLTAAAICPVLVPPADNFCPNGTITPVYEGSCIVGYRCIE